ncbi:hypothetical protein ZEAMMB73_Zm00001d029520 [Zea mays]|uniref:Uncharacterized protein n=1 Tax=Zea mays TaxID=4577 RepID=A0A1D6K5Q0_MAIZE|nr:hypothetical protein ZEAMMB73_Zm00001d029520 [Zea mays]
MYFSAGRIMDLTSKPCLLIRSDTDPCVTCCSQARTSRSMKRRPPGPRALPFIGCIHHVLTSQPQAALRDLAQKHGPEALRRRTEAWLAAELARLGDHLLRQPRHRLRALRRLLALAAQDVHGRAPQRFQGEAVRGHQGQRDHVPGQGDTPRLRRRQRRARGPRRPAPVVHQLRNRKGSVRQPLQQGAHGGFPVAISVVISNISGLCVSDLFPSLRFVDALTGTKRRLRRRTSGSKTCLPGSSLTGGTAGGKEGDWCWCRRRRRRRRPSKRHAEDSRRGIYSQEGRRRLRRWPSGSWRADEEPRRNAQGARRGAASIRAQQPDEHEAQMDKLRYTKTVIKETLRLYPPLPLLLPRQCERPATSAGSRWPRAAG